ncbi:MAG: LD-carboxypeptidase [candidate division Zixibacteria bacterium]|nr:LD-carboxypeptidase [Candidatus Tariuqbacter arcticus]
MIKPRSLRAYDTIAIVSPASSEKPERFDAADEYLSKLGFRLAEGVHAREKWNYFAGADEFRSADFNDALRDDSVNAIIGARGGYGCSRLLPLIDYEACRANPKIIIGSSDLTAILWAVHQKTGLAAFYGPMALQIEGGMDEFTGGILWRALKGKLAGSVTFPTGCSPYCIRPGIARGRLIGGCLSLVVSLLGTEYFGEVEGRILFLEEIGEKPYRIDRMLTHLRNAGVFDKIAGLLLGDFRQCWEDERNSFTLEEILHQILPQRDLPVMAGLPFGHCAVNMTLPLGVEVEMEAENGRLAFLEEGVEF